MWSKCKTAHRGFIHWLLQKSLTQYILWHCVHHWLLIIAIFCLFKMNASYGTLLVVQWLRFCTPSAGGQSSIPGQRTTSYMPQLWSPVWTANSLEMTLMLGKTEGRSRRGRQTMRWLDGITDAKDMSFSKHELGHTPGDGEGQEDLACCSP